MVKAWLILRSINLLLSFFLIFSSISDAAQVRSSGGGGSSGGGSGTVNSGSANQVAYYATTGTAVSGNAGFIYNGSNVGVGTVTTTSRLTVLDTNNPGGIDVNVSPVFNHQCTANAMFQARYDTDLNDANCSGSGVKTGTAQGSAAISNSIFKIGTGSLNTPNGTSNYVSYSDSTDFTQSGDMTFQAWIYFTTLPTAGNVAYFAGSATCSADANCLAFAVKNNAGLYKVMVTISSVDSQSSITDTQALVISTWYHMAFVRTSGVWKIYFNGNQATGSWSNNQSFDPTGWWVGNAAAATSSLQGYIDEVGFYNTALYSSNFTPATQTGAQPKINLQSSGTTKWGITSDGSNADTLTFSNGAIGTNNYVYLTTGGNLGVGSAAPGQVLDVNGTIRIRGTSTTNYGDDNSVTIGATSATSGGIQFGTNSLTRATIDNTGNIGIGTPSPLAPLHLVGIGSTGTSSTLLLSNAGSIGLGTATPRGYLTIDGNQGNFSTSRDLMTLIAPVGFSTTGTNNYVNMLSSSLSSIFSVNSFGNVAFGAGFTMSGSVGNAPNNAQARVTLSNAANNGLMMYPTVSGYTGNYLMIMDRNNLTHDLISANGNLGIGTVTTPGVLTVNGGVGIGTYNTDTSYLTTAPPSGGLIVQGNVGIGTLNPATNFDVEGTRSMFGGNVGIGTFTPPTQALLVNGTATFTTVGVVNIEGTRFVFGSNFTNANTNGFSMQNASSLSTTAPTIIPNKADATSGFAAGVTGGANIISGGTLALQALGGNVGIGSAAPGVALDVQGTIRTSGFIINTKSTTGIGWSEHNAANQACNTTCGTSACVIGLDAGTVGVLNSNFVACTDATADDCICAGP